MISKQIETLQAAIAGPPPDNQYDIMHRYKRMQEAIEQVIKMDLKEGELTKICRDFINGNHIGCADKIQQSDYILEDLPDFVEKVCDHVGYWKDPEDEENEDADGED